MARDVNDDIYYMSTGGKIPVKWTAPEVSQLQPQEDLFTFGHFIDSKIAYTMFTNV